MGIEMGMEKEIGKGIRMEKWKRKDSPTVPFSLQYNQHHHPQVLTMKECSDKKSAFDKNVIG